jgi:hypothetical protein
MIDVQFLAGAVVLFLFITLFGLVLNQFSLLSNGSKGFSHV